MTPEELQRLVEHLRSLPKETEWVELKHNNADPQEIGEQISALANGAALHRQPRAFVLWGVEDNSHNPVGTTFQPRQTRIGNEELENWLLHLLTSRIIKDTIEAGLIRQAGGTKKDATYVPFWT